MTDNEYMVMSLLRLEHVREVEIQEGKFMHIIILPSKTMILELTKEGWEDVTENNLLNLYGTPEMTKTLEELMEDHSDNGWFIGTADEFGNLSEAPFIARGHGYDKKTGHPISVGGDQEWWFPDYQVADIMEKLLIYGRVALRYIEDNNESEN